MKKMSLAVLEKQELSNKSLSYLLGGEEQKSCGCACRYANQGGSSTKDNGAANKSQGLHSPGMMHVTGEMQEDGTWILQDRWVEIVP